MLEIKNQINDDGTICFNSSDGSTLIMRIDKNQADVIYINAADDDIYDGLVKTAAAYSLRRAIAFNKKGVTWKETHCQSCQSCQKCQRTPKTIENSLK